MKAIKVLATVMEIEALTETNKDENITGLEVRLVMVGGKAKLMTTWPVNLTFVSDDVTNLSDLRIGDEVEVSVRKVV